MFCCVGGSMLLHNALRGPRVGLMLAHRLRRRPSVKPAPCERPNRHRRSAHTFYCQDQSPKA